MNLLNKSEILAADDLPVEVVSVPEWGGAVRVRGLSGTERDQYERQMLEVRGAKITPNLEAALANARAKLCARCMVDASGARMFEGDDDLVRLGQKSASALQRVFDVARRLSGLTDTDIVELAEGINESPFGDSRSASASRSESPVPAISPSNSPAGS